MGQAQRWMSAAIGTLALLSMGAVSAPSASASTGFLPGDVNIYAVTVTGTITTAYNPNQLLASCSAGVGGTCTISRSVTATRTFQVALGVSVKAVAAELGWSSSTSVTVEASCTSPKFISTRQVYKAHPRGVRKWYTVKRTVYNTFTKKVRSVTTSAPKQAFSPNGVKCELVTA